MKKSGLQGTPSPIKETNCKHQAVGAEGAQHCHSCGKTWPKKEIPGCFEGAVGLENDLVIEDRQSWMFTEESRFASEEPSFEQSRWVRGLFREVGE